MEVSTLYTPRTAAAGAWRSSVPAALLVVGLLFLATSRASAQGAGEAGCVEARILSPADAIRVQENGRICAERPLRWTMDGPGREEPGAGESLAASLLLPGAGQWMQGKGRAYAYAAAELLAWAGYAHVRHEGTDLRTRYRDLAWRVARSHGAGSGIDGGFDYFEALARYPSSGAWDRDPQRPGLQPETDPGTYNGRIWTLARQIYSLPPDPADADPAAYERALSYYRERGYGPEMAWSWEGRPEAARRYRDLIDESDDAFRRATVILGVIAANHILSAVDGFLSARIASEREAAGALRTAHHAPRSTRRWHLELSLGGFP